MTPSHAATFLRPLVLAVLGLSLPLMAQSPDDNANENAPANDPPASADPSPGQSDDNAPVGEQDYPDVIVLPDSEADNRPLQPEAEPATRLDAVVVTAQKREQAAVDVPMSLTAIGGDTLEKMGADGVKDIAFATPSFSVFETAPGSQTFQMRGISSLAIGTRSTVGYYLDDISLTALPGFQMDATLYDLRRVEVLRGPQGTLYGEGSMGGTLKLITNPPDLKDFSASARELLYRTSDGSDSSETYGMLNVPLLRDTLAGRLVFTSVRAGGFIDQTERQQPDANFAHKDVTRLSLASEPADWLKVGGLYIHQDLTSGSLNYADDNYERQDHTLPGSTDVANIYSMTLEPFVDWAGMLVSYSSADRNGHFITDGRQAVGDIVQVSGMPITDSLLQRLALATVDEVPSDQGIASQTQIGEIRLNSIAAYPWQWTGGLYYRDATETNLVYLAAKSGGQEVVSLADYTQRIDSQQYAIFGQADYAPLSWLNLTLGLRYFRDQGVSDFSGTLQEQDATNHDEFEFSTVNPRLVISSNGLGFWLDAITDSTVYVSASKGFRSGGVNSRFASGQGNASAVFQPDYIWTYEIGGKAGWWDDVLTTEVAVFYNDWRNVQLTTNVDGGFFTANSGNATGLGVDLNVVYRPLDGLSLTLSGSMIDAAFNTSTVEKEPGDPMDFVPPRSGSVGVEYNFNWFSMGGGLARIDYSYQDANRFLSRSAGLDTISDPIHMLNARIGFERTAWQAYLFGRNLTDFRGVVTDSGAQSVVRLRPINLGVEFKVTF